MANFAVNAADDVIAKGKELIEKLSPHGEKQGDALAKMFRIVEEHLDEETMKQGGVDVEALDSSLENIRNMFLAAVTGREQIVWEKDSKIAEIKKLKDQMEADLREKLRLASAEKDAAVARAEAVAKVAAQAAKDAQAAEERAEIANSLVSEKDRTISTLADKLSTAESRIEGYDSLMKKNSDAQDQIKDLQRTMDSLKKDHDVVVRELNAKLERQISDAEKDAALAVAKAVANKERELTALLRESEKEIARLQARIEIMEAHK